MNVTLWLISWTPYMIFCVMGTWGDQSGITPLPSMLQSLLAKTSCAYNPVIYCLSHPKFREVLSTLNGRWNYSKTILVFSGSQATPPLDVHRCRQTQKDRRQPFIQLNTNWIHWRQLTWKKRGSDILKLLCLRFAGYKGYSQSTQCIRYDACNVHLTTRDWRTLQSFSLIYMNNIYNYQMLFL